MYQVLHKYMYIVQVQEHIQVRLYRYRCVKVHLVCVASKRVADGLSEFGHGPGKNLVPFVTI